MVSAANLPLPASASFDRLLADLHWRANELKKEVQSQKLAACLQPRQSDALQAMMAMLIEDHVEKPLAKLSDGGSRTARENWNIMQSLGRVWQVWDVFRTALERRRTGPERRAFQIGDILAAQCFGQTLDQAGITQERPASPLVHAMACDMPSAIYPDLTIAHLGLRVLTSQRVPLPIAAIPMAHLNGIWLMSFLYHEIGHFIDFELDLSGAVEAELRAALKSEDRLSVWRPWIREIVADAFGVLFGGPTFAMALADLLCTVGPARPIDPAYPPYWLRVSLVIEMVKQLDAGDWREESQILAAMEPKPTSDDTHRSQAAYAEQVAASCLQAAVPNARNQLLQSLAPSLTKHWSAIKHLAESLASGRPAPPAALELPLRLIPAAAVLALSDPSVERHKVQVAALEVTRLMPSLRAPRGEHEAAHGAGPIDFYRQLSRDMEISFP